MAKHIAPLMKEVISHRLTRRQRQAVILYYEEGQTQVQVANELGISQPTVNQHLRGKKRRGRIVGGALRRIEKELQKTAEKQSGAIPRNALAALSVLLDPSITRRKAADLLLEFPTA